MSVFVVPITVSAALESEMTPDKVPDAVVILTLAPAPDKVMGLGIVTAETNAMVVPAVIVNEPFAFPKAVADAMAIVPALSEVPPVNVLPTPPSLRVPLPSFTRAPLVIARVVVDTPDAAELAPTSKVLELPFKLILAEIVVVPTEPLKSRPDPAPENRRVPVLLIVQESPVVSAEVVVPAIARVEVIVIVEDVRVTFLPLREDPTVVVFWTIASSVEPGKVDPPSPLVQCAFAFQAVFASAVVV